MGAYTDAELEHFRDSCHSTELHDAVMEARADRDEARRDAEKWERAASDCEVIIADARSELARWEKLDAMTSADAFAMREAFRKVLRG